MIKQRSKKGQLRRQQLIEVYKEIDEEREPICSGCNRGNVPLSHSHIVPVSNRKDLELDKNNIKLHCLSIGEVKGCHSKWESNWESKKQLLDFEENIEYMKRIAPEYYNLILMKENG